MPGISFARLNIANLLSRASSGVPTPASNIFALFMDSTSLKLSAKNSSGTVVNPVEVTRYISLRAIEANTSWPSNGSTNISGDFPIPFAGTLKSIRADVDTAGTTGTSVVDVNLNGTTIMSTTKLQWDSAEKSTSTYSGTAATLSTTSVAAGDIITIDVDTNHTVASKGLTVTIGVLPS